MKKGLIIASLFLLTILSFGSIGRITGLNAPYWAVDDTNNVLYFPNLIFNSPGVVQLESLENSNNYFGGFNYILGRHIAFGIYFRKAQSIGLSRLMGDIPPPATTFNFSNGISISNIANFYNCFDFIGSIKFGENLFFGFSLNMNRFSNEYSDRQNSVPQNNGDSGITEDLNASELNFKLDISIKNFVFFNYLDLGMDYGKPKYSHLFQWDIYNNGWYPFWKELYETKETGYMGFWLMAKSNFFDLFFKYYTTKLDNSSYFGIDIQPDGIVDFGNKGETEQSSKEMIIGISKTIKKKAFLMFFAGSFNMEKILWYGKNFDFASGDTIDQYDYDTTDLVLNFYTGIEYFIKKWLTLRGGFSVNCPISYSYDLSEPTWVANAVTGIYSEKSNYNSSTNIDIMLGSTFHFGMFDIDLAFRPDNLLDIFIATGNSHTLVAQGSIIYRFK